MVWLLFEWTELRVSALFRRTVYFIVYFEEHNHVSKSYRDKKIKYSSSGHHSFRIMFDLDLGEGKKTKTELEGLD